jgi:hypothetical protein
MNFHRLRQPLAVWLALLIALFGAIAPTLSVAMGGTGSSVPAMVDICSSGGDHAATAENAADTTSDPTTGLFVRHCPLCLHAADRVLPLPSAAIAFFGMLGEPVSPATEPAFAFITPPARVPPPRGPPAYL